MPQATTFTVNDDETTPVAHSFTPRGKPTPTAFAFRETAAVPIGDPSVILRWQKQTDKFYRRLTFALPTLVTETINGVSVPSVSRTTFVDLNVRYSMMSTDQERRNALKLFSNMTLKTQTFLWSFLTTEDGIW